MTDLKRTARVTGLWYLGMVPTGMLGFLIIRPSLYVPDDALRTAQNLSEQPGLAHLGVALELGVVVCQALAALGFYKLLRSFGPVEAFATAAFGLLNAMTILISAACLHTSLQLIAQAGLTTGGDVASTVQLLWRVSSALWKAGCVFFGLWLIPMGQVVRAAGIMPTALGWILQIGGALYVLSAFVSFGIAEAPAWLADSLSLPATVGEFWMIGYLLSVGIRPTVGDSAAARSTTRPSSP